MTNAPHDLRDYVLGELSAEERSRVERYLEASSEARAEVERLKVVQQALMSVPEEEPSRRIAFVSDKVFEPSALMRFWREFWGAAPRLAFGLAAVLVVLFAGIWWVQPTVVASENGFHLSFGRPAASSERPDVTARGLTEVEIRQAIRDVVAEGQAQQLQAVEARIEQMSAKQNQVWRAQFEDSQKGTEDAFLLMKSSMDSLQREMSYRAMAETGLDAASAGR